MLDQESVTHITFHLEFTPEREEGKKTEEEEYMSR